MIMKTVRKLLLTSAVCLCAISVATEAADNRTKYRARPGGGSIVEIEGTSTIHDWHVQSLIVGGSMEAGPSFTVDPAKAKPGKLEAKATVFIPVRSLKSMKEGKPYSTAMDDIMYEKLLMEEHKNIQYDLVEMTLKEVAKGDKEAFLLDTKGELKVAGKSKTIEMPVKMTKVDDKKIQFEGTVSVKMSDFGIEPPAPKIAMGAIKTGDDVTLKFNWVVGKR